MRPAAAAAVALLALAACWRGSSRTALLSPDAAALGRAAPDSVVVAFVTSRGAFDVLVRRLWAPRGADRIHYLAGNRYFDGVRFFRTVDKFVTQFGLNGDTAVSRTWRDKRIQDDSVTRSNVRGTLSFAAGGPNTRTTQLFISFGDNSRLDRTGFAVFGQVIDGMETVVDSLYKGYGEGAPRGKGPEQGRIQKEGNAYLTKDFPKLDYVITARVIDEWRHR